MIRLFRCSSHPKLPPHFRDARLELQRYVQLATTTIAPDAERMEKGKDGVMHDTFDLKHWWVQHKTKLPSLFQCLRGVLTHSTNSAPPERLFSILNDTFQNDMQRSYADYIELSLMLQFNKRSRK